jgi:hypothetical protein
VNSDKVDSGQKYSDASNIPYIFHKKQQFFKNISLNSEFIDIKIIKIGHELTSRYIFEK